MVSSERGTFGARIKTFLLFLTFVEFLEKGCSVSFVSQYTYLFVLLEGIIGISNHFNSILDFNIW